MTIKKVKAIRPPYSFERYTHMISPISKAEGGGFLITFPDLPGCMSDGETEEEAIENGRDAFLAWVSARADQGKPIPEPQVTPSEYLTPEASGRLLTRLPKSLHARLIERAKREEVSINSLILAFVAAGLGKA